MVKIILEGQCIRTAIASLDLYVRIFLGQMDAIDRLYQWTAEPKRIVKDTSLDKREECFLKIRNLMFPDMSEYSFAGGRGIYNEKNDPKAIDAYNMLCVIRSEYAWFKNPRGGRGYDFYKPIDGGRYPPAQCEIGEEDHEEYAILHVLPEQYTLLSDAAAVYSNVLSGKMRDAFTCYTNEANVLAIAEESEKYKPTDIDKEMISQAEDFSMFISGVYKTNAEDCQQL